MAKKKLNDEQLLAYLSERREALKAELTKIKASIDTLSKGIGKKKKKGKLAKAVKTVRKKVSKTIKEVKNKAEDLVEKFTDKPEVVEKAKPTKQEKATKHSETDEVKKPKTASKAVKPTKAIAAEETPTAAEKKATPRKRATKPTDGQNRRPTWDGKILAVLSKLGGATKAEIIDQLNTQNPDYGLGNLKRVTAFRLNHLVKSTQITAEGEGDDMRYRI